MTTTPMTKRRSPPRETPTAPRLIPFPVATPVLSAMMPTQRMSSQIVVPKMKRTKGRSLHFISSIVFARSVVAESQIAAPRKRDCTWFHPSRLRPTV